MNTKFIVLPEKRRVVALSESLSGKILHGVAKCNETDEFDEKKGKELAFLRLKKVSLQDRRKEVISEQKEQLKIVDAAIRKLNNLNKTVDKLSDKITKTNTEINAFVYVITDVNS